VGAAGIILLKAVNYLYAGLGMDPVNLLIGPVQYGGRQLRGVFFPGEEIQVHGFILGDDTVRVFPGAPAPVEEIPKGLIFPWIQEEHGYLQPRAFFTLIRKEEGDRIQS
jgi:hypothetical protein